MGQCGSQSANVPELAAASKKLNQLKTRSKAWEERRRGSGQGLRGVWGLIRRGVRTSVASTQRFLAVSACGEWRTDEVAGTQARQAIQEGSQRIESNLLGPTRMKRAGSVVVVLAVWVGSETKRDEADPR